MSKRKYPRRVIGGSNSQHDLGPLSSVYGHYYGQNVPTGGEQNQLFDKLLGLGAGLPNPDFSPGTGSTGNGMTPTTKPFPVTGTKGKTAWQDLLATMSNNGSNFSQLLASLGINGFSPMTAEEGAGWNKQLLDQLLAQYVEEDKRRYNEERWKIENTYNSPLNQLSRLMGAGISRDAAIQILSRAASGSSGSSITGAAAQLATGNTPSEIYANKVGAATQIANTVFGGISALSGLLGLGFSAPQAIQQTKFLQNQNALTQRQLSAYDSTGRAFSILNAAGAASDAFGSVGSAISAITKLAKDGNADAIQFIHSGGLDTLRENANFASQAFKSLYGTERASKDYASSFDEYLRGVRLDNNIKQLDASKISAEISLIGTQEDAVAQSIIESMNRVAKGDAEIQVLNEQGKWIHVQAAKTLSDIDLVKEQITGQQTANKIANQNYEYNDAGFAILKQNRIDELTQQAQKWDLYMRNPDTKDGVYEQNVRKWLLDPQNAADAAYVISAYNNAIGDFARNHPSLYSLGVCFHDLGIDNMLKVGADAGGTVATVANLATKLPL